MAEEKRGREVGWGGGERDGVNVCVCVCERLGCCEREGERTREVARDRERERERESEQSRAVLGCLHVMLIDVNWREVLRLET